MSTAAIAKHQKGSGVAKYDEEFAWSQEQTELIKRTCAMDATDDELKLFLHFCKESGVDPLRKQAHFVCNEDWSKKHNKMVRSTQMIVGIDGFRKRAEQMPDYRGIRSSAVYKGETIEIDFGKGEVSYRVNPLDRKKTDVAGAYAIVFRDGRTPYVQWIDWAEYFDGRSPMHRDKPAVMCCKTAEATALRHEYPDKFSGMYAPEEMPQEFHVAELMVDGDEKPKAQLGPKATAEQADAHLEEMKQRKQAVGEPTTDSTPPVPPAETGQPDQDSIDFAATEGKAAVEQAPTDPTESKEPSTGKSEGASDGSGSQSEEPPPPTDSGGSEGSEGGGAPPSSRNIPQEIRISYGAILNGIQMCLDLKFTKQQASDLLGHIMLNVNIPAFEYVEKDGLVHTKKMSESEEGAKHATILLNALKGPNALDRFKKLAQSKMFSQDPSKEPNSQTPNKGSDPKKSGGQEQMELPAGSTAPTKPVDQVEELRKSVVEIQACIGKEHGTDGIKLGVVILQSHDIGPGKELAFEKISAANTDLVQVYTELCSGKDVKVLLAERKK